MITVALRSKFTRVDLQHSSHTTFLDKVELCMLSSLIKNLQENLAQVKLHNL